MIRYSIIVPVYNRPEELNELLESLLHSNHKDFEIIVVEDGSLVDASEIIKKYEDELPISYFVKENTGQGFSRNFAVEKAAGEYIVFFDSDCLIPANYFDHVEVERENGGLDFWGGPDDAHSSFSVFQKTITFTLTSILTTGGIRGSNKGTFQPRTFNMGIRRELFLESGGFTQTNMGEDVELSTRLIASGVKSVLIEKAKVYHKRRGTLGSFFRQMISFGRGRSMMGRKQQGGVKLVHWLPTVFMLGLLTIPISYFIHPILFVSHYGIYSLYFLLLILFGSKRFSDSRVGIFAVPIVVIQFAGYSWGFLRGMFAKS